jgi:hypothetical protein
MQYGYWIPKRRYPIFYKCYPILGAVKATSVVEAAARSRGKLWALRSCITSNPSPAEFKISAQVLIT